ncbi:MAG: hypothetical protein SVX43_22510 [Cyanobacteriota bacterium]|nr:hypothetical protein [Cyanobacteriota bacterium]
MGFSREGDRLIAHLQYFLQRGPPRDRFNSLKDSGVPAPLARGRCAGMAARRLFYRLVEETGRDLHP